MKWVKYYHEDGSIDYAPIYCNGFDSPCYKNAHEKDGLLMLMRTIVGSEWKFIHGVDGWSPLEIEQHWEMKR